MSLEICFSLQDFFFGFAFGQKEGGGGEYARVCGWGEVVLSLSFPVFEKHGEKNVNQAIITTTWE